MSLVKRALVRTCIASAVAALGFVGVVSPASAAGIDDIKICNSSGSWDSVRAYKTDNSWSQTLGQGQCTGWINDTGSNPVRVDVNWVYAIGIENEGYGTCHGPNNASNPPSGDYPKYIKYRNTRNSYCDF
jgi:hypothetical protein